MLTPYYKKRFKSDLKLAKKRGKSTKRLYHVMEQLIEERPLPKQYIDHALKGEYADCRECHIEPDWLLIYLKQKTIITFIRTGTHSDLFKQ